MRQYETFDLSFSAPEPEGSHVEIPLTATFTLDGKAITVDGFYAGDRTYKVRFLPEQEGTYSYKVRGLVEAEGTETCEPRLPWRHGPVRADGTHFCHADGTWFYPFGTTVYAFVHQPDELVRETLKTLEESPFNKIRICVFPKHYDYNQNEPPCFPFMRKGDGWDVHHPDPVYWNRLESVIQELDRLGIQCDLILFHPYDRWGFSKLSMEETLTYLDYVTRRFSSFQNLWWSLANEYDLMAYGPADWDSIEAYVAQKDPFHHLLSNHQILTPWHWESGYTTHICSQTRELDHISALISRYGKPMMVDECCYEGNLPQDWGNISGFELVHRFWTVITQGAYCTHGETFLSDDDVIWWAKGGKLKGQSPSRIGFLRGILESLPGPITFAGRDLSSDELLAMQAAMPEPEKGSFAYLIKHLEPDNLHVMQDMNREFIGACEDKAFLKYYGRSCPGIGAIHLPEGKAYDLDVIDIWEMTCERVMEGVSGDVKVKLPGKEGIALLATVSGK